MQGSIPRYCLSHPASIPSRPFSTFKTTQHRKRFFNFGKTLPALILILVSLLLIVHKARLQDSNTIFSPVFSDRLHQRPFSKYEQGLQHQSSSTNETSIPNIVHFVHLIEPSPHSKLELHFHQFVAIYSAYFYLHPLIIYVHTNIDDNLIDEALLNSSSPYTKAVSKLPTVLFKHHDVANETSQGRQIERLAHKSDFIRTDILKRYGGIYLDDDSYVLRDLHPLRSIGFENILGIQDNGQLCSAVMITAPGSKLMTAYDALQDRIFDGSWDRHSVTLLAKLATEFADIDHQVLVLPQDAFFPLSWKPEDLHTIYDIHQSNNNDENDGKEIHNTAAFTDYFNRPDPHTWRRDWRSSYVLHGWTSAIGQHFDGEEKMREVFGGFGGITLEYVLARNSNFARAVFPAVRNALDVGILEDIS